MTRLGIVAESEGDLPWVCGLADRVLCEEVDWVSPEVIDAYRVWCGHQGRSWMDLHSAWKEARSRSLRCYGRFDGEPGAVDAHMFRAIFLLFLFDDETPDAVVVCRDVDGDEDRIRGFEQASRGPVVWGSPQPWPFEVIAAMPKPEIEAWLIAAFSPQIEEERSALAGARRRLGFDPRLQSERLTSRGPEDKKDAKRVLEEISCARPERVRASWESASLADLTQSGQGCGLAAYIGEVRAKLVPIVRTGPA